jgi:hypothetical protein
MISQMHVCRSYPFVLVAAPANVPRKHSGVYVAASLGFEPRQRDPESLVLPLHHEAMSEKIKDR